MEDDEDVLFQEFLYKLKPSRSGRLNRFVQDRWKMKYFILTCCHQQLLLKCYNKKPKQLHNTTPKTEINLGPSFKVEKLVRCHSRAFGVELTAATHQLCLSADNPATLDRLVFLLMTQIRLRDNITDNLVEVRTDQSEAFTRIGAKGVNCLLHVSPWGLTLVLKPSRAVVAQWPLKSVRYYESSGQGQFVVEAGMVAPLGSGVFTFGTTPGHDNRMYDTVDHYVIHTLDRVKPSQRGTAEEIEDYLREFDCLHSLTALTPTPLTSLPEVTALIGSNWASPGPSDSSISHTTAEEIHPSTYSPDIRSAGSSRSVSQSSVSSPGSPLTSNNANRPLPSPHPSPQSPRSLPSPHPSPQSPRSLPSPHPSPHPSPQSPRFLPSPQSPRSLPSPHSARSDRERLEVLRTRASPAKQQQGRLSGRPPPPLLALQVRGQGARGGGHPGQRGRTRQWPPLSWGSGNHGDTPTQQASL
ncbi:hypothetical protein ACOMHN_001883 [Nucella lapillus]